MDQATHNYISTRTGAIQKHDNFFSDLTEREFDPSLVWFLRQICINWQVCSRGGRRRIFLKFSSCAILGVQGFFDWHHAPWCTLQS